MKPEVRWRFHGQLGLNTENRHTSEYVDTICIFHIQIVKKVKWRTKGGVNRAWGRNVGKEIPERDQNRWQIYRRYENRPDARCVMDKSKLIRIGRTKDARRARWRKCDATTLGVVLCISNTRSGRRHASPSWSLNMGQKSWEGKIMEDVFDECSWHVGPNMGTGNPGSGRKIRAKENQKNGADTPLYRPHFALPRQMIGIGMQKQLIEISIEMEKVLGQ
jgi:hypothetical protein